MRVLVTPTKPRCCGHAMSYLFTLRGISYYHCGRCGSKASVQS